jgi:hypothetical protein
MAGSTTAGSATTAAGNSRRMAPPTGIVVTPWCAHVARATGEPRSSHEENAPAAGWEKHEHEGLVHTHQHFHITHNHDEMTGGFEHLSSAHEHEHNHAPMQHAHVPHQDFEREHAGEAHVHDHDQPTGPAESHS